MIVTPRNVAADHAALLAVAGMIGAVQGKIAQAGELRFDVVEPRAVVRRVGQFHVVRRRPGPDPGIGGRGQVR